MILVTWQDAGFKLLYHWLQTGMDEDSDQSPSLRCTLPLRHGRSSYVSPCFFSLIRLNFAVCFVGPSSERKQSEIDCEIKVVGSR